MKILLGYDGSDAARKAMQLAKDHALAFNASVSVLAALTGDTLEQIRSLEQGEQDLAYAELFFKEAKIPVETKLVAKGTSAGEALVSYAEDNGADEIILGIVKTSKVGKLLFGSTAQHVILRAPCPVVTIKP